MKPILEIRNLSKEYQLGLQNHNFTTFRESLINSISRSRFSKSERNNKFWALKDISFDVYPGESIGIIGRNGAGKSTLLKILSKITPPTKGLVKARGRLASLLEVGTGFHAELTGRENIYLNGSILGLKKIEIEKKFDEIVAFSGVERFLDTTLKHYSSGMQLRLAFAVAAHLDPEILVVDEVLAVGDAEFQKKCFNKMDEVSKGGRTILFVSHNMAAVKNLCQRGILLNQGEIIADDKIENVSQIYLDLLDKEISKSGESTWKDGLMSGSTKLKLYAVRLKNEQGKVASVFGSSEQITIEFEVEILEPVINTLIQFAILTQEEEYVFSSARRIEGEALGVGKRKFVAKIPKNIFNERSYKVLFVAHSPNIEYLFRGMIVSEFNVELHKLKKLRGIVAPKVAWEN